MRHTAKLITKCSNTKYFFHTTLKRPAYGSRITLTSPDPSAVSTHKRTKRDTAASDTHEVTFTPYNDATDSEDDVAKERKIADEL